MEKLTVGKTAPKMDIPMPMVPFLVENLGERKMCRISSVLFLCCTCTTFREKNLEWIYFGRKFVIIRWG